MRVTFLGSGTSHGVPMIGCHCRTCESDDPRDKRWRPSIYLESGDGTWVLVDTTPDLRSQALAFHVSRVDAILFTHGHADHVFGLDEIRRFNAVQKGRIPCFSSRGTLADIRRIFWYAFDADTPVAGGVPQLDMFPVEGPFCLGRLAITPVPIMHGQRSILGFRVGNLAYLTDCSGIPESSLPLVRGVDVLVIGALRDRPHPTHFTVSQAIEAAIAIGSRQTYFTHIAHDLSHEATCARLPAGMELAYDGLSFEVDETAD